jgi:hypothetical protein
MYHRLRFSCNQRTTEKPCRSLASRRRVDTTSTKQTRAADTKHGQSTDPDYDINDKYDINRSPGAVRHKRPKRHKSLEDHGQRQPVPPGRLTAAEALEEIHRPKSGPGLQARLYRAGEISRENAVKWICCAIIYCREGRDAPFSSWRQHAKAVEDALELFCGGGEEAADKHRKKGGEA